MTRIVVLSSGRRPVDPPAAVGAGHGARRGDRLTALLTAAGHTLVPVSAAADGDTAPAPAVLGAAIAAANPGLVLVTDWQAAGQAVEAGFATPLWLDLPVVLLPTAEELAADRSARSAGWLRWTWILDRADVFSCAAAEQRSVLAVQLGVRGRLSGAGSVDTLVHRLGDHDPLPAALAAWLAAPARTSSFGAGAPMLSRREFELADRAAELEASLAAIHRSRTWRLWARIGVARRSLRQRLAGMGRGLGRAGSAGIRLAVTLALLPAAGWRLLRARGRRRRFAAADFEAREAASSPAPVPGRRPRLLIVCPYPIHPPDHGGAVRLSNLIRHLAREVDVHVLLFNAGGEDDAQRAALEAHCASVTFYPWQPGFARPAWSLTPPNVGLFAGAEHRILDLVKSKAIDVMQLEYTEMAPYGLLPLAGVSVIFVEHDIGFRGLARRRRLGFGARFPGSRLYGASLGDWLRLLRCEVKTCDAVERIQTMSGDDAAYLASFLRDGARRIRVVPNAVDVASYRPPSDHDDAGRRDVLFVGNYQNLTNLDALEHFMAAIWPRVRARRPHARLSVVGAKMPAELSRFDGVDGVTVVGAVPDMRPIYHRHRVLAVPLRAGSGTRLKLFEAFAAGLPAVSTAVGAEGIAAVDGEHLLIADAPDAFAAALDRLLSDDDLWRAIAEQAGRLVAARYDWSVSAARNLDDVRALTAAGGAPSALRDQVRAIEAARVVEVPVVEVPGTSDDGYDEVPGTSDDEVPGTSDDGSDEVPGTSDDGSSPAISVIIPTFHGGRLLDATLASIRRQRTALRWEVLCIDSGSSAAEVAMMSGHGARVVAIDGHGFNHGLTRDFGAAQSRGEVLVFLNQDAIPCDERWLHRLTAPLFDSDPPAAVQGGQRELPPDADVGPRRFYWDSMGERFYFTRESDRWIRAHGLGFSTVNAAFLRSAWRALPFGWAPIMEDKKWQRAAAARGYRIVEEPDAAVFHTHDYDLRSLTRRCLSEGYGWRLLDQPYRARDMVRDMATTRVWRDLAGGIVRGRVRSVAALVFPVLRPAALWIGNRWRRDVTL